MKTTQGTANKEGLFFLHVGPDNLKNSKVWASIPKTKEYFISTPAFLIPYDVAFFRWRAIKRFVDFNDLSFLNDFKAVQKTRLCGPVLILQESS